MQSHRAMRRVLVAAVLLATLTTAQAARYGAVRTGKVGARGTFIPVTLVGLSATSRADAVRALGHHEADVVDVLHRGGVAVTRSTPIKLLPSGGELTLRVRVRRANTAAIADALEVIEASLRDLTAPRAGHDTWVTGTIGQPFTQR